jgi:hypothetical protein
MARSDIFFCHSALSEILLSQSIAGASAGLNIPTPATVSMALKYLQFS